MYSRSNTPVSMSDNDSSSEDESSDSEASLTNSDLFTDTDDSGNESDDESEAGTENSNESDDIDKTLSEIVIGYEDREGQISTEDENGDLVAMIPNTPDDIFNDALNANESTTNENEIEKRRDCLTEHEENIVIKMLLNDYLENNNSRLYFLSLFTNALDYEMHHKMMDQCLKKAIEEDYTSDIPIFGEMIGLKQFIRNIIEMNSPQHLSEFNITLQEEEDVDDFIQIAVNANAINILHYFLENDPTRSAIDRLIDIAIKKKNKGLINLVGNYMQQEEIAEFITLLYEKKFAESILQFFQYFSPEEVLIELEKEDVSEEICSTVALQAKFFMVNNPDQNAQMNALIERFSQLTTESNYLLFPRDEPFNGDERLKSLRETIANNPTLSPESRVAANLIGITLSTHNRYFSESTTHQFAQKHSEHYIRSGESVFLRAANLTESKFAVDASLPESNIKKKNLKRKGAGANLGLFKSVLPRLNDKQDIEVASQPQAQYGDTPDHCDLYNTLLNSQAESCRNIEMKFDDGAKPAITVGFYNQYPCLMVYIDPIMSIKPKASHEAWVTLIMNFFTGMLNNAAKVEGLNIEMVKRSSFGFLSPSIAPCENSFRINVGIIPQAYEQIIAKCLNKLNRVLNLINRKSSKLNFSLVKDLFLSKEEYKAYKLSRREKVPSVSDLFDVFTAQVERGGNTAIRNMMRTPYGRDSFMTTVSSKLENAFESTPVKCAQIFLDAINVGLSKMHVDPKDNRLRMKQKSIIKSAPFEAKEAIQIEFDDRFVKTINTFVDAVKKEFELNPTPNALLSNLEIATLLEIESRFIEGTISKLYKNLDELHELLFARVVYSEEAVADFYGSDSEDDNDDDESASTHYFGKKVIVQNGMRAIYSSLHAAADYLKTNKDEAVAKTPVALAKMYYEAEIGIKLFDTYQIVKPNIVADILMHDANACEKNGKPSSKLDRQLVQHAKCLIIDTTSATLLKQQHWFQKFLSSSKAKVLFFVSSGLKNEGAGNDKNHYGTIRVFAKNQDDRERIINFIKSKEFAIKSNKVHLYRKLFKRLGCVVRNRLITESFKIPTRETSINTTKRMRG